MKLLITGAWREAGAYFDEIRALGHEICFQQQETDPLPCALDWVEGVICNSLFLHHSVGEFAHLRYIQLTSAGLDRVDLNAVQARGIEIRNARGVYSIPMAEFAVCGVLQLYKQAAAFARQQQARCWEKRRDLLELAGKTVTILGCGSVGTECAKRFAAFGCRVLGVDIAPRRDDFFEEIRPLEALEELLPETDVLLLTLPLTDQTRGMVGAAELARLRQNAILVNIARGAIVDQAALTEALKAQTLAGAVLDVFEQEPLAPDDPIWALPNVLITPHNSFVSDGNPARLANVILSNLRKL